MLQVNNLEYKIGERELLRAVKWTINPGKRIALIGPNGAGKTTLLCIIAGEQLPFTGEIIKPKGYKIGFLPQEEIVFEKGTVLESVLEGRYDLKEMESQINDIQEKLKHSPSESLLQQLGSLEHIYTTKGGYQIESEAKSILSGLGYCENDFHRLLAEMSGGWRMRAFLARILIQKPDLLLLDEPTNHLDLESLEWLEQYLLSFSGSVVMVSHDRFFIDRLAHEIAELENGKLVHYPGNYRFYEEQKSLYKEQMYKKWDEIKAEREHLQKFIDRFRYKATKASQVQSRIKRLEKLDHIDLPKPTAGINFKLRVNTPSFNHVLKIRDLFFRYDDEWILENISLDIYRGQKIALVGVNGSGKTTFTRLINSDLYPDKGMIDFGKRTFLGYYAQHQIDALHPDSTVYDEVTRTLSQDNMPNVRNVLGVFKFSGDDICKKISVLSGGEKARVSLAKILLSQVNFLVMDEPTNHLDMHSKKALEEALIQFDGTLLMVSHDRYFLDRIVSRVIEIKHKQLNVYEGNYSDYLLKRESIDKKIIENKQQSTYKRSKEQKRIQAEIRQTISKKRTRLQNDIESYEYKISELERKKAKLEQMMTEPESYQDEQQASQMNKDYKQIKNELVRLETLWEESQLELEELLEKLENVIKRVETGEIFDQSQLEKIFV